MSADDIRLQPRMYTEREIAMFVRMIPFEQAVALIEQYGRTRAAEGKCDHAADVYNFVCSKGGVDG